MISEPLNYRGFFILTWKSLISNKLFCGGEGTFSYFLTDFLGVFLGEGGGGGIGYFCGGSSKSGYLMSLIAVFITIF